MLEIIKIGIFSVVAVLLAVQFKGGRIEYALYIGIGAAVLVFFYAVQCLRVLVDNIGKLQGYMSGSGDYLYILIKIVGITYICEFCASVCKDAGYAAVAGQIEVLGKMTVMLSGLPILLAVLAQIQGFM